MVRRHRGLGYYLGARGMPQTRAASSNTVGTLNQILMWLGQEIRGDGRQNSQRARYSSMKFCCRIMRLLFIPDLSCSATCKAGRAALVITCPRLCQLDSKSKWNEVGPTLVKKFKAKSLCLVAIPKSSFQPKPNPTHHRGSSTI